MRIAIVAESFLPQVNGVSNTVRRMVDRFVDTGHHPLVVAPGPGPEEYAGAPVVRVRSVGLPGYRTFPVGLPDTVVERSLALFGPHVVHLASPVVLGAVGLRAARRLGVPVVAAYQTDVAGFARQYGGHAETFLARWVARLHRQADRTLVPSRSSHEQLAALAVPGLHLWRRGVDLDQFRPGRRDPALHRRWQADDPAAAVVGYVGRLAAEKQVHRLETLSGLPGVRLVVVGDGPARADLERRLPTAAFTGMLDGEELGRAFASLDVFVHTGDAETFCQTVQEAQASGTAVVAPAAGGPLDLVRPGRNGLLFAPEDARGLARAVALLAGDPALRRRLAAQARLDVAGRRWEPVVDELVHTHYAAVLGRPVTAGVA